ncbi:Efflux pump roqT [Sparassis crispa]|uniref:Efflux pump roqT n=1 Tax=Sparassis crispa TaxID=139825 RepID=A0A401GA04_9APHY|nr:Efflux pump roqT [Sparassis crispa]GBE78995.1 Efflux pump roqT [Sparassis crispa]
MLQPEDAAVDVSTEDKTLAISSLADKNVSENLDGTHVSAEETESASQSPLDKKMWSTISAFMVSILLANLDQTIVATALPRIASQFDKLSQSAWVATSYLLTFAGLMLFQGQLLTLAPAKHVYLCSLIVFGIGSLICAVARSFPVLIFGRAFAGTGGAGVVNAVLIIIAQNSRIEDRTMLFSLLGMMHALASIVGPLIGGAFTDHVTWRWCFFINLPFVGVIMVAVFFFLKTRRALGRERDEPARRFELLYMLDWVGAVLSLAAVVALLLPLQWGGATYAWDSAVIIALFVVSGVLMILFVTWEYYKGSSALLPLRLFLSRTQVGTTLESAFIGLGLLNGTYYLPLWYQAQGHSATKSGVDILPFMLSVIIASIASGAIIKMTGRYWHVLVLSPLLCSIGAGLLSSLTISTPNSHAIGFQILYGVGVGGAMQNVFIACQAEWEGQDGLLAQATTVLTFTQVLGGVAGVSISGTIFTNLLRTNLRVYAPQLPAALVVAVEQSVTAIAEVAPDMRAAVLHAYTFSISRVFLIGVPAGALASLSGMLVRNIRLQDGKTSEGVS